MAAPQLRQINVTYVDLQDRLLLKVSTSEEQEYRVWCTRRYTRLLLDRLEQSFEKEMFEQTKENAAVQPQAVPEQARREVAQMQHKQSVNEQQFQQPYEAQPKEYPLGEQGVLVSTLKYKSTADGIVHMHLADNRGNGVTLNLNEQLKHQVYELFTRAAEKAEWFSGAATATPTGVVH